MLIISIGGPLYSFYIHGLLCSFAPAYIYNQPDPVKIAIV